MDLNRLLDQIKSHPDYAKVGMILCHKGVVRGTTREGRPVTGMRITVDHQRLAEILAEQKQKPGIVEILVEINEGLDLGLGQDVMHIVVAGDIREHVIAGLAETLNRIKAEVTGKTQFFVTGNE